ncbi:MAG: response regulator transcription factor [Myxococcaceae bacterium]
MARVLVVEDSPELAALIASALSSHGHVVRAVSSGLTALALLSTERFDAGVVDLQLPDIHGNQVLSHLRSRGTPAIAMSGHFRGSDAAREAERVFGARAFLEKPFPMGDLLLAIERLKSPGPQQPPAAPAEAYFDEEESEEELLALDEEFTRLARTAAASASPLDAGFRGPLGADPLGGSARLFWALARNKEAGELSLSGRNGTREFLVRSGQPIAVRARTPDASGKVFELRRSARPEQVRTYMWDTFTWETGEYVFTRRFSDATPLPDVPEQRPGDWVLQGLVATQSLEPLEARMPPARLLWPTATSAIAHHWVTLGGAQASLLAAADGTKTVADLLTLSELPRRETLATLEALETLELLEERTFRPRLRGFDFGL